VKEIVLIDSVHISKFLRKNVREASVRTTFKNSFKLCLYIQS
jgi:Leu/Phe-tRNA-protein transferase